VLEEARTWGFLGPGPVAQHLTHSRAFLALLPAASLGPHLDLGSGGGVPGLVLAAAMPATSWILLDAQQRRTAFLSDAVGQLGLQHRVEVRCQRAEDAGRSDLRGTVRAVVARGFSGPAATAECAAPLLGVGGVLVIAEPPGAPERWSEPDLAQLGLAADEVRTDPIALRRFVQRESCSGPTLALK